MQMMNISDWMVRPEASFSDHKYISFNMGKYTPHEEMFRNLRKADWKLFQSLLNEETLPEIQEDGHNLDHCAEVLQSQIANALDVACPLQKATKQTPDSRLSSFLFYSPPSETGSWAIVWRVLGDQRATESTVLYKIQFFTLNESATGVHFCRFVQTKKM